MLENPGVQDLLARKTIKLFEIAQATKLAIRALKHPAIQGLLARKIITFRDIHNLKESAQRTLTNTTVISLLAGGRVSHGDLESAPVSTLENIGAIRLSQRATAAFLDHPQTGALVPHEADSLLRFFANGSQPINSILTYNPGMLFWKHLEEGELLTHTPPLVLLEIPLILRMIDALAQVPCLKSGQRKNALPDLPPEILLLIARFSVAGIDSTLCGHLFYDRHTFYQGVVQHQNQAQPEAALAHAPALRA